MCCKHAVCLVTKLAWVLLGAVTACGSDDELVAVANGDYDPNAPPQLLELSGALEIHNPFLLTKGSGYEVYGSGEGLHVHDSPDLLTYTEQAPLFAKNPAWVTELLPETTALWSPSVAVFGGKQHLYYAASVFAANTSCIGHATRKPSSSAAWQDQGHVICSNLGAAVDDFNAIDPSPYVSETGEAFLVFGSYESGIKLLALTETGNASDTPLITLATRPAETPAIQAPALTKRGRFYYLFVSFDQCCVGAESTYNIRVGRSKTIEGPYLDRDDIPLLEGGGTLVLESNARFKGPGSCEVFVEGSSRYLVYHAYDAEQSGRVTLRISELRFDNDGWPVTAGP